MEYKAYLVTALFFAGSLFSWEDFEQMNNLQHYYQYSS